MNIIVWVLFGLAAGIVMYYLDEERVEGGLFGSALLGIGGAFVGGLVANLLFGAQLMRFDFSSLFIAAGVSLLILAIYHAAFINPEHKF